MKYMLMMGGTKHSWETEAIFTWPKKDVERHLAYLKEFREQLEKSGELVDTQGLTGPERAKVVRAGKDGAPITDGVFPESKEFLAGYVIVDCETEQRACEIAARWSAGPGRNGVPLNMPVEVRPVMSGPPSRAPEEYV